MRNRSYVLQSRAAGHRRAATWSEAALWRELSSKKLRVAFRRQVVLADRFIVDFLAPARRLVVEVDGGVHRERRASDARRDRVLARLGYRVLRIPAELVTSRIDQAVALVRAELAELAEPP